MRVCWIAWLTRELWMYWCHCRSRMTWTLSLASGVLSPCSSWPPMTTAPHPCWSMACCHVSSSFAMLRVHAQRAFVALPSGASPLRRQWTWLRPFPCLCICFATRATRISRWTVRLHCITWLIAIPIVIKCCLLGLWYQSCAWLRPIIWKQKSSVRLFCHACLVMTNITNSLPRMMCWRLYWNWVVWTMRSLSAE